MNQLPSKQDCSGQTRRQTF